MRCPGLSFDRTGDLIEPEIIITKETIMQTSKERPGIIAPEDVHRLVFAGGGARGAAFYGVLRGLERVGIDLNQITEVAGTSAGSIEAFLLSLGCDVEETICYREIVNAKFIESHAEEKTTVKVAKTMSSPTLFKPVKGAMAAPGVTKNLIKESCVVDTTFYLKWFQERIEEKTGGKINLTFSELGDLVREDEKAEPSERKGYKHLTVTGTDMTSPLGNPVIFSEATTPNALVADAVLISMSIPGLFKSRNYRIKPKGAKRARPDPKGHIYADGGIHDNYPLGIFNDAHFDNVLGFCLVTEAQRAFFEGESGPPELEITNLKSYLGATYEGLRSGEYSRLGHDPVAKSHTVFITTPGLTTLSISPSEADFRKADRAAYQAVLKYFGVTFTETSAPEAEHDGEPAAEGSSLSI